MVVITVAAYKNAKVHPVTVKKKKNILDENDGCTKRIRYKKYS